MVGSTSPVLSFLFGLSVGLLVNFSVLDSRGMGLLQQAASIRTPCDTSSCPTCPTCPTCATSAASLDLAAAGVGTPRPKVGHGFAWFGAGLGKFLASLNNLPAHLRKLPIVDVGVHDGSDVTLPASRAGHRVYAYEPTSFKYDKIVKRLREENIPVTDDLTAFRQGMAGVLLRRNVACSGHAGTAKFTTSEHGGGVVNSLYKGALPKEDLSKSKKETVTLVTLSEDLKEEKDGLLLLKMDCQGCEYHGLLGALDYVKSHKVYIIYVEFYSKGLQAADKKAPLRLLEVLTIELAYQCFDVRTKKYSAELVSHPLSLEEFVATYHYDEQVQDLGSYGRFTDLLCVRFDLL